MLTNVSSNAEIIERVEKTMWRTLESPTEERVYFSAYLAYYINSADEPCTSLSKVAEIAAAGDALIHDALEATLPSIDSEKFFASIEELSTEHLRAFLSSGPRVPMQVECPTPEGISALALSILDLKNDERVIDFGSGFGNFLEYAAKENDESQLVGIELNPNRVAAARICAMVSGSGVVYECSDMFAYCENAVTNAKADKAFSNYPWRVKGLRLEGKPTYLKSIINDISSCGHPASSDWMFNRLLVDSIKEDGIAVGIMTNGAAFNKADIQVRKYFIENGWVQAAISLPAGLFSPWTGIATTLIVLSHGNGDGVRLVDATDLGSKERRGLILTKDDVLTIANRLNEDSDKSTFATIEELSKREYSLSANRFLQKEINLVNPVAMKSLMLDVTRGAGLRAQELDELTSAEETNIHYLNLANISDGRIDESLPCLKELDSRLDKYCLETGDLLVSKNGAPYRVAVAEVPEGQQILANGNLYIIKLDTKRVDPYYVAAFLNSSNGKEILNRASKGSVIPNLPLSELREIKVPLEDADKQARIASAYRAKLDDIGALKLRLACARQELAHLFDGED